jgi:hypothetical protein
MIVCRKPCTLYDVDVIGLAVLLVIVLAAWFGVILPAGAKAAEHRELSAKIVSAAAAADQTGEHLRRVSREMELLQIGVAGHMDTAPKPGALTPFLDRVASLATRCGLEIMQVLPRPVRPADGYLACVVSFTGRGRGLDLARLIHELSLDNPYFALQSFSIKSSPHSSGGECELSWALRLYMLEDGAQPLSPAGGITEEGRP